ncbi:arylsulfatase [Halioglobus japonicus]|uniref:Arylsulfatase n=1 Tax=Halioglobus japonicus TaxID=930805 RepID=A0AAP8MIM6_9GAMM|nr:arylsulfatase [Halioglobus japonicus]AQA20279.1 arylsulfatase [Halioglobus japonicus]PLW88189.1 arylsulfatase [Halioglobus japonicus]
MKSKNLILWVAALILSIASRVTDAAGTEIDRTRLPIPQPAPAPVTALLPEDVELPTPWEVRAPEGAPNVVIILLDDIGFGAPSPFGGPVSMPTLQQLADTGISYNRFHTIALCAPTRAALKSGRNHHRVNMGSIPEIATGYSGNTTVVPNNAAPIAEILRQNGYNTGAFGKWHETPGRETTAAGPQTRWPTRQGFEKFYGFIGAEENMYEPSLHDGVTVIDFPDKPGYHLLEDMTDQAISWVRQQQGLRPDKPFFIYYSSAGSHSPHQVASEWIERYRGKFDQGWDVTREKTHRDQIALGVVPKGTQLPPKPASVPDWNDLSDDQRRIFARQAEVFAAFTEYADYQAGRLLEAIDDLGELDNTLVFYISGDNGTSSEGNQTGHWNWGHFLNGVPETTEEQLEYLDEWGGPTTYAHMAVGWAIAFDAPFAFTKQVAGDFGGTRNGTVVHWPSGIKAKGELREQFTHVIDVVPTILEATGIPEPEMVDGVTQIPIQGTSMMYSFDNANAPERHTTQYFEVVGNRGLYQDGWLARTTVKLPWESEKMNSVAADDGWELYNTLADFSLTNNLADEYPERLASMKATFMKEAVANQVLPLDDRLLERLLPSVAGRPTMMGERTELDLYPGSWDLVEDSILSFKNVSSSVIADLSVSKDLKADGVIIAQGSRFGGWSFYIEDGYPCYTYNNLGDLVTVKSKRRLPPGDSEMRLDIDYDGGGAGKGALMKLSVNGKVMATERLESTVASRFSIDEGTDVGMDRGSPVIQRQLNDRRFSAFNGTINKVTLAIYPD